MRLSRAFCNFMCRRDVISGTADLDQIGKLTNVDILPIYEMNNYWSKENIAEQLDFYETDIEKEDAIARIVAINKKIEGNTDKVLKTIEALIAGLSGIADLHKKISTHEYDTLGSKVYYANFNEESNKINSADNFGKDLRNFKRFLDYAKFKGTKTVYFNYG